MSGLADAYGLLDDSQRSGTSGPFKGVALSHGNIIANVLQLRQGKPLMCRLSPKAHTPFARLARLLGTSTDNLELSSEGFNRSQTMQTNPHLGRFSFLLV